MVCKHHDGFCLWPTKTTRHNIANTKYKNGKGDLVREISDSCRKYDIKFGVYISPWDRNNAYYGKQKYVTIFQEQIQEVLSSYGPIFEMWIDGANGGDGYYGGANEIRKMPENYYRWEETFAIVHKLQSEAVIMGGGKNGDLHWPGNENGYCDPECRCTMPRDFETEHSKNSLNTEKNKVPHTL